MIVFDLACGEQHRFEGWFADSDAYETQRVGGRLACPICANTAVERVISVPQISTGRAAVDRGAMLTQLARAQAAMLKQSAWVGDGFATRARAMAEGSEPHATIHGQATLGEAKALHDDGIAVTPLPFPVVPPKQLN